MASLSLAITTTETAASTTRPTVSTASFSPLNRTFPDPIELPSPRSPDAAHLPRAASYSFIPQFKDSLFDEPTVLELKGRITEADLTPTNGDDSEPSSGDASPETEGTTPIELGGRRSASSKRGSRLSRLLGPVRTSSDKSEDSDSTEQRPHPGGPEREATVTHKRSLSKLRRKSWYTPTTPSTESPTIAAKPTIKEEKEQNDGPAKSGWNFGNSRRKSLASVSSPAASPKENVPPQTNGASGNARRKGTVLSKKPRRPSSVVVKGPNPGEISAPDSPKVTPIPSPRLSSESVPTLADVPSPLPKSFSTDRLPSFVKSQPSFERVPPLPRKISTDKLKIPKHEAPKKKDELWSVFRELDASFQKFQAKSIALKPNVVRASLLPFLREYAVHPSSQHLRAEDLDRRANILNRWWTGLLDALGGKSNQSVTGTDRYAILDGILGIMERPEWRVTHPFRPLGGMPLVPPALSSVSTTSLSSNSSDFLVDSVHHNVRNIFIENILSQLAYVVDHMSLRQAPASLVSFSGKTCAYAFFFCPGVADIMIRLWDTPVENLRRVLEESGLSRSIRLDRSCKTVMEGFPPELSSVAFSSLAIHSRELRKPLPAHLRTANVNWRGPWLKRWSGKDSDLFYVFVKHYHILLHDFLPPDATEQERLCAPGLLVIQAQLLTNIDATIHRHSSHGMWEDAIHGATPVTFDDLLDADANAAPLPLSPSNATRLMPQNRVIMLLREFLSGSGSKLPIARQLFAESFCTLLKASTRRISLYDYQASYTLCDFLEEAFDILIRYENSTSPRQDVLDWPFWLTVWKKMVQSQNTATEIKLYSFLYTVWTKICGDDTRKLDTCVDFLLMPEFFHSRFNHWCPMVRAYYMRLVCWRVARFDGDAGENDLEILERLQGSLFTVWAHYLYLRDEAAATDSLPPSTAPCPPAPGRRLLIIRTDAPITPPIGPLLSFDSMGSRNQSLESRNSLLAIERDGRPPLAASSDSPAYSPDEAVNKGRWSLLGKVMGMTKTRPKSEQSPERPASRLSTASSPADSSSPSSTASPSTPLHQHPNHHQTFCFRFSLEWTARAARPPLKQTQPPQYRLEAPRLPPPAQAFLQSHGMAALPGTCRPLRPQPGDMASAARYAGRALAEWQDVVCEFQNFVARRRFEGVPRNGLVETPGLGVEGLRRPG